MHFTYTFKSSEGVRKIGEIDAPSRDIAFATLRTQGIRPIRMFTKELETVNGGKGYGKRVILLFSITAAFIGILVGKFASSSYNNQEQVTTYDSLRNQNKMSVTVSQRHWFNYSPNENEMKKMSDGEKLLSKFALPGEGFVISESERTQFPVAVLDELTKPTTVEADASQYFAELKGIIAGLKEEAMVYIRTGAGLGDYLVFLIERQKMESESREKIIKENSYREAQRILSAMKLKPIK